MRTIQLSAAMLLVLTALFASGCEDHYTTQEAYAACTDLTERNPATNPPTAFDDCVDCYETCGLDCTQAGTAPETYVCPDESGEGTGGGG
jgi:hypothetical protein